MNVLFIQFSHITKSLSGAEMYHHNFAKWLQSIDHDVIACSEVLTESGYFETVPYHRYSPDLVKWADMIITTPGRVRKPIKGKEVVFIQHNQNKEPWDLSFGTVLYCANHVAKSINYKCKQSFVLWPFNRYQDAEPLPPNPDGKVTLINCNRNKGGQLLEVFAKALPDVQFLGITTGYGRQYQYNLPNIEYRTGGYDLREVLKNSSMLIMPSEREGLPTLALEATSLGVPVLMNDIPAARELGSHFENLKSFSDATDTILKFYYGHRDAVLHFAGHNKETHQNQLMKINDWLLFLGRT